MTEVTHRRRLHDGKRIALLSLLALLPQTCSCQHPHCSAHSSGSLPVSLARQPQLGTLRLGGNQLGGTLEDFAGALPPQNHLFHFDVSSNQISGHVPDGLQGLGVFSPDQQFVTVTPAGQVGSWGDGSGQQHRTCLGGNWHRLDVVSLHLFACMGLMNPVH